MQELVLNLYIFLKSTSTKKGNEQLDRTGMEKDGKENAKLEYLCSPTKGPINLECINVFTWNN